MPYPNRRVAGHLRMITALAMCCAALPCATRVQAEPTAEVKPIDVEPREAKLTGQLDRLQIRVTATDSAGRKTDATRTVQYESLNPEVIAVDEFGRVVPLADGKATVRIRHGKQELNVAVDASGMSGSSQVGFATDVIPVLTKAGCNQGSCHATQYGQGGLTLSLLGYAPEQDHPQLVRDLQQRRVSLVRPEDSLILRKATLQITHGGGQRFLRDSYEYQVLKAWVAAQVPAPSSKDPKVVDLVVSPLERIYRDGETQQLRVVAHYSDGRIRDVTNLAKYDSLGDGVAMVESDGFVTAVGHGQAAIMIRFQGQAKVSHVLSPYADDVDLSGFVAKNFVDEKMIERWKMLGVTPTATCSDEEFLRRAFLDSIGTLPTLERTKKFLESNDPGKRDALVDELLGLTGDSQRDVHVNAWSAYWTLKWGDLLRNNRNDLGDGGMWAFANWMRQSLRENKPVDQFVREIITAEGSIFQNGPANYYKISKNATDLAETTAQVFLGVRLQCARCHHHPFEVYSQADYYGLAAFFTNVGTKSSVDFGALGGDSIVKVSQGKSLRHPRNRQTIVPTPLLSEPVDVEGVRDLRRPLASWLTSPENPLFARNIVNRVWGYFLGSGIVEPIDDMRATNPPSNPELLDALAADFVANGYDLRHLMRVIMTSNVYQRQSTPTEQFAADTRLYLHYNVKRLPAEVLLDAIDDVCGTQERFRGVPPGTRAIELPDPNYTSYFLDTLGRPQRVIACECERTAEPNLAQVLHVANGELINRKLTDKNGRISQIIQSKKSDDEAIAELYLVAMCRQPTPTEIANCHAVIARAKERREGLEDLLWALCNSREFLFNH